MNEEVRGIAWEAYEHHHIERKSDWFWGAGILIVASCIASILLGNTLLGILIATGGVVMLILAARPPKIVSYAVTQRGLRIDEKLYPYTTLEAFYIDEDYHFGPQLLVRSEKLFMPLLILPIPEEHSDIIEAIIAERLPEQHIEEPFSDKVLEFFGF